MQFPFQIDIYEKFDNEKKSTISHWMNVKNISCALGDQPQITIEWYYYQFDEKYSHLVGILYNNQYNIHHHMEHTLHISGDELDTYKTTHSCLKLEKRLQQNNR